MKSMLEHTACPASKCTHEDEVAVDLRAEGLQQWKEWSSSRGGRTEWHPPPEGFEIVDGCSNVKPRTIRRPIRTSQAGIRAPRSSFSTEISASPRIPSPAPDGTARSLPPTPPSEVIDPIPWQDYDIPEELGILKDGTPKEIRSIIQASLDEHRAIRTSKLRAHAIVVRTTIETKGERRKTGEYVGAECKANASASSRSSLDSPDHRSESGLSSDSSATTPDTEVEDCMLKPPTSLFNTSSLNLRSQGSSQSLRAALSRSSTPEPTLQSPRMATLESRLQESKDRTTQSHNLFNLVPTGKKGLSRLPELRHNAGLESYECSNCFDEVPAKRAVDGLLCHHKYCQKCFSQLVSTAMLSESSFPPKCCLKDIPRNMLQTHLSAKALSAFDAKALEYAIPKDKRYYCVLPNCGQWIDMRSAKRMNGTVACPHCETAFCPLCRGPRHKGTEICAQDRDINSTLRHSYRPGKQHCYKCQAVLQNTQGSKRLICGCHAELCSTCGSLWRTCQCPTITQPRRENLPSRQQKHQHRGPHLSSEAEKIRASAIATDGAEKSIWRQHAAKDVKDDHVSHDLASHEAERRQRITAHFQNHRRLLESARFQQKRILEVAHERDDRAIHGQEAARDSIIASRETEIISNAKIRTAKETDAKMNSLKRQHATALMETINRHRRDQDDLLASPLAAKEATSRLSVLSSITGDALDLTDDLLKATILENLLPAQEAERVTLKAQQARELSKWRIRGDKALQAADSQAQTLVLQMRLEEAQWVEMCVKRLRRRMQAEWKWFEVVWEDRLTMLHEEEAKALEGKGDPNLMEKVTQQSKTLGSRSTSNGGSTSIAKAQAQAPKEGRLSHKQMDVKHQPSLEIEEAHPGRRVYYGPTDSWAEREEKQADKLRQRRGRR